MSTTTALRPRGARRDFAHRYGPWAVVTGASSGIGQEFARQLAAAGLALLVTALCVSCGGSRSPAPASAGHGSAAAPSSAKCDELLEHVVHLAWLARAAQITEGHGMMGSWNDGYVEDRYEYKKELRATQGPRLSDRCMHSSLAHVDCALAAKTIEAVATCDALLSVEWLSVEW